MASYNRVILVGNLTRDPEMRYIPSGTAVTEIGMAISGGHKSASGEWVEETTFVDVTLWARTAEVASEYLSKGLRYLSKGGSSTTLGRKTVRRMSKLRVVGERMQMLGGKGGGGGGGGPNRPARQGAPGPGPSSQPQRDEAEYAPSGDFGASESGDDIPF